MNARSHERDTAPTWRPGDVQAEEAARRYAYARARDTEPSALPGRLLDLVEAIVAQLKMGRDR